MEIIAWIGVAQGLFAAIMLLTKANPTISDRVLSGWLSLLSIEFLTCALDFKIFGFSLLSSSFLLFNPALYIYIRSLVQKNFRLKWMFLLHLIPFLLFEITAYITKTPFTFQNFFANDSSLLHRIGFAAATIVSWLVYMPLSVYVLHIYKSKLEDEKSNIEKGQSLNWLLFVSFFYILYSIIAGVLGVVFVFLGVGANALSLYNYAVLLALIYIISFYGLYQKQIEIQADIGGEQVNQAYKNSILSNDTKKRIRASIIHYFEKEKAYLNPDLNMDLLSEAIGYPKYQITEVLNVEIGKNFFQFVNTYRIEAVKKMLLEPQLKFSIEAIGYECGFNSKSSFYTVFKATTGQTPVNFRKTELNHPKEAN